LGPDAKSVELYEQALALQGAPSPTLAEQAGALLAWGLVHWNRLELDEARRCAEEARALAVDAELGRELGEASALLGMVAHAQGCWRELFRREFVESLTDRPDLAPFVLDAHLCLAEFSLYGPTSHEEVEPFARSLLAIATDAGSIRGQALACLMLGEAQLFAGRLHDAASTLSRAVELHRAAHASSGQALALIRMAEAEIAGGHRLQASRRLMQAIQLAQGATLAPHLLARAYAAQVLVARDADRGCATVDEAERVLSASQPCQPCSIGFHVAASMTRARAGDVVSGRRHLDKAERIAGMWQGGPWEAAVWEARGRLRAAEGDAQQGVALLREAADRFARAGRPLDAARCRAAAG
jgi:tetratricopeptide (TPR) repeat protein